MKFVRHFLSIILMVQAASLIAKNTPMESFINRVKETNQFVTVNNIWQADNNFDKTAMLEKVENAQPLLIDYNRVALLLQQKTMGISLQIPGVNGVYTIDLARYDIFTNDFEVHTLGANNTDSKFAYTPGLYYRGVVSGIPGSVAAFSFFNNEVYGIFSIPGEGNYVVAPNVMVGKYYNYNQHYIVYNDNDLKIKQYAPKCSTDELPEVSQDAARTTTTLNNDVYNNCTEVRVFEVGDYALYMTKGHSVTNVTNYLTALFNNQAVLYRNEGIPIALKYIQIDSTTDNYQHITSAMVTGGNPGPFLDTFGKVTQNTLHGCDLAILVSTAQNGGYGALGGVAWLQSMCRTYRASNFFGPYAFCDMDNSGITNFPTFSWDVEVITHEMGHVVGSPHTHRCCWNPPGTGTTAIDGCYTLEGSCATPSPALPTGGGTIMSYCHLTSAGINFSNGFGPQPGDTIRYFLSHTFSSSCGVHYLPSTALATANRTKTANRECTDLASGISTTYYWNDNNTADQTDDTLVLMVVKNGNNIGTLDSTGFSVSTGTLTRYGSGRGDTMTLPTGLSGVLTHNIAMRRYWQINATTAPTSAVDVYFPFMAADTADVDGSVPGSTPLSSFLIYKVNSPMNPDPSGGFTGATASSFSIYTYGTAASTSNWAFSTAGSTYFAHMKMNNLSGGGTGFYTYRTLGIDNQGIGEQDIYVYPNPSNDVMNFVANGANIRSIIITDVQGRSIRNVAANSPTSFIHVNDLAAGLYYAQIHTDMGTVTKKIVVMK